MRYLMPKMLIDALADGSWKNVSPDVLRRCLGDELDDLQLFESTSVMKRLATNLEEAGYVDDPQFCMTREQLSSSDDPKLEFPRALFIGGSAVPGDDVFVAIRQLNSEDEEYDPPVLVFDWRRDVPYRWTERGTLSELISRITVKC